MSNEIRINDSILVGGQPSEDRLQQLRQDGFKAVVNLRTAGEEDQPMSPEEEQRKVSSLGMKYVHIPVSMKEMSPDKVDEFRRALSDLPDPVYVHCKSGKRSGAFSMMHIAVEQGLSGDEALERAASMGFECDKPELEKFVRQYVDRHRT